MAADSVMNLADCLGECVSRVRSKINGWPYDRSIIDYRDVTLRIILLVLVREVWSPQWRTAVDHTSFIFF